MACSYCAPQTLREELRKVQNSAALLERQRNPGVGYWTSRTVNNNPTDSRTSIQSVPSGPPSRVASPVSASSTNEEEVNLEYLRNVILQFLEHKEMRVRCSLRYLMNDSNFFYSQTLSKSCP